MYSLQQGGHFKKVDWYIRIIYKYLKIAKYIITWIGHWIHQNYSICKYQFHPTKNCQTKSPCPFIHTRLKLLYGCSILQHSETKKKNTSLSHHPTVRQQFTWMFPQPVGGTGCNNRVVRRVNTRNRELGAEMLRKLFWPTAEVQHQWCGGWKNGEKVTQIEEDLLK